MLCQPPLPAEAWQLYCAFAAGAWQQNLQHMRTQPGQQRQQHNSSNINIRDKHTAEGLVCTTAAEAWLFCDPCVAHAAILNPKQFTTRTSSQHCFGQHVIVVRVSSAGH
jgi:hypothetical protein